MSLDPEFTQESHAEIRAKLDRGEAVLLDVREQDEWDASHLAQAFLVPISELANQATREAALNKIPKDKPVYCHCYRGGRAMQCAQFLNPMGYQIVPMGDDYEKLAVSLFDEVV
jgi:rhodanese-related sulfurtransferase